MSTAPKKKLSVAFLWHMHQPLYKDLVTGEYRLPWVRLHSTYSYLDMVAILDRFPEAKVTFNLTPSLIWQLDDISRNKNVKDKYLELSLKDASILDDDEKVFILRNFFSCDHEKAILPWPRYKELYERRGSKLDPLELIKKVKNFDMQDYRDIQVLFNLAWCGFTLKNEDRLIRELVRKGSTFSEKDKKWLLKKQENIVCSILPAYKRLQDEGRIEISTTPYYHPILPLLCKGKGRQGYDFTKDARVHVRRAIELYKKVFGHKPKGMWPAEGAVSPEIIPLLEDEGIKWIATDEGILLESFRGKGLPREDLIYKGFTAVNDGKKIDMVFRDINISNAISFRYAKMNGKRAAQDMWGDIYGIKKHLENQPGDHVAAIILDGENPWPYYPEGGETFLEAMYKTLSKSKDVELVTIGDFLASCRTKGKIEELHSGSWIDRNFRKWIGSPQKNKAWHYLEKTREALMSSPSADDPKALEELYIAEGSDWFWWYDDFGSELDMAFDDLYRMHLRNIYTLIGKKPPYYLEEPVPSVPVVQEVPDTVTPAVMGRYPRILFVCSEAVPFAKTGGLADVSGSLPRALISMGCDVRVMMPLYSSIPAKELELVKEADKIESPLYSRGHRFDLYSNRSGGLTTYFVKKKRYYYRGGLYGTSERDYSDNSLRFGFFSQAVLAAIKALDFRPDVIHCNDWQTALVPFYLKFKLSDDPFFKGIKTLYTIHNMAYQGVFVKKVMLRLGIPDHFFNMDGLEFYGHINFMKAGILYADAVNTVSHRYAEEIMTAPYGCGLDGLLRTRKDVLYGIPNGADYSIWNPEVDKNIKVNYNAASLDKKIECKSDLLEYTRLPLSLDTPLLGCVTRLAHQKGMDIFANIMDKIVKLGAGVVVLGKGDESYTEMFSKLVAKYPKNIYVSNEFNDKLAHKIEAGCDIFVMPSRYEPCGLNQIYSIKYGTIPVVRATGGLDDVIKDFDEDNETGNGFKFGQPTEEALYETIRRAVEVYRDKNKWRKIMVQAMAYDFSWEHSGEMYLKLYRKLMDEAQSGRTS